ncbi:hypothetical protein KVL25_00380 [Helicobacter pylori]|nr:hypothetical protein KVL25_00380 [Helicobacter pylori]
MGTFIEKCLGFYQVRQVREELEARISELEDENENLTDENTRLLASKEWPTKENAELLREKDNLVKANAELKKENDKLNHQIIALTKEQDSLKQERAQLQDAHGSLKELCADSEKDNQRLADKLKKLESAQKNLENSNDQLLQAREKIAEEKTEMEKEMARLKDLETTDKSELDLQNRRFKSAIEDLAQAEKITNELVEKTLEIISYSDVDVDFEAFEKEMLNVDKTAVGLKRYSQSQLLDLDGGHWDLEAPRSSKESVTFRFDNLPKDPNGKEENFYARSSLKDLEKNGIVAIDFGTKSMTAIYMNKNGRYCLLSIGGDVDAVGLEKYENPTIVEFRNKEKFLKAYNALSHRLSQSITI